MIRENSTIVKESWHMVGCLNPMDFAILDNSLRIKTKTATLYVNPQENKKIEADAALFTNFSNFLSDSRLNVTGPGEYEVAGVKISGQKLGESLYFQIEGDNIKVGIGKMSEVSKQDKIPSSQISIVELDIPIDVSSIIAGEPVVILAYGQHSSEVKDTERVSKFSVSAEKLPQETQTVVIG